MKLTIQQILQQGITAQNEGKLQEAENFYRNILEIEPSHQHANHNLGVLNVSVNKVELALPLFKAAIKTNPKIEQFWLSYIDTLVKKNELEEAEIISKKALDLKQNFFKINFTLNIILLKLGKLNEAEIVCKKLIAIKPDFAEAHNSLGNIMQALGRLDDAAASFRSAIALKSDYPEAYNNLGNTLKKLGRLNQAEKNFKQALTLRPDLAEIHYNLANTLKELGKLEEMEASFRRAIAIRSDFTEAYNNLGYALNEEGNILAAIDNYKQAINNQPDCIDAWDNIFFSLQIIKSQNLSIDDKIPSLDKHTTHKYAQATRCILNYRLNLGTSSVNGALKKVLSILSSDNSTLIKNPEITSSELITEPVSPKKIIALLHFGRSGTGLLHSLVDKHPKVSTLPSIYLSEFFDYFAWKKITVGGWKEMADRFVTIYEVLFEASSATPIASKGNHFINNIGLKEGMMNVGTEKNEVLSIDKKKFVKELKQLMNSYNELDAFTFFKLVHSAYNKALNDHNKKNLIFYHIHNPSVYAQLNFLRLAPNTNWLMMIREPIQSCESWIKSGSDDNDYKSIAYKIFQMLFEIDQAIFDNDNSIGIRLEDLKENPKKTIQALCDWLGIKEEESLYQMTAQGKKWWGDPASPDYLKEGMDPFGKSSINRQLGSVFSKNDQFILQTLFYPFSVHFGYIEENLEKFKKDLQTIRPMLDQIFDFERKIIQNKKLNTKNFMKSGSFLYLRSGMIERWNTLNKFHTYSNMLTPLKIN